MAIGDEFRAQLAMYQERRLSLDALFKWLASHVQEISSTGDENLRELEAQVWLAVDDVDDGSDTESNVREWLGQHVLSR